MGAIADERCVEVILTNEDPYDEDPLQIVQQMTKTMKRPATIVMDRRAAIARAGRDATVLAYGMMLHESLAAADLLAADGIDVEVVDLRTLLPLDRETILASLAKRQFLSYSGSAASA